jgi:hypothetical protein
VPDLQIASLAIACNPWIVSNELQYPSFFV